MHRVAGEESRSTRSTDSVLRGASATHLCRTRAYARAIATQNRTALSQRQESHHYTVDGVRVPRSVTAIAHEYQPSSFNPQLAIESMRAGKRWAAEKRDDFIRDDGCDMSDEEICSLWEFKGRVASARGTLSPGPLAICDGNCP